MKECKVRDLTGIRYLYTYFVEQLLELFIVSYLKVYVLQEPSAKGTAVISALEKLVHYVTISYDCPFNLFAYY